MSSIPLGDRSRCPRGYRRHRRSRTTCVRKPEGAPARGGGGRRRPARGSRRRGGERERLLGRLQVHPALLGRCRSLPIYALRVLLANPHIAENRDEQPRFRDGVRLPPRPVTCREILRRCRELRARRSRTRTRSASGGGGRARSSSGGGGRARRSSPKECPVCFEPIMAGQKEQACEPGPGKPEGHVLCRSCYQGVLGMPNPRCPVCRDPLLGASA